MIALSRRALQVTVLPEVGGKIAQIRFHGQDLLIAPRRPYCVIPPDRPWVEYDTSGMDDCFPNVDEGPYPVDPWRNRPLPQMGEWVRGRWNVTTTSDDAVTLERAGSVLPYVARKRVELTGDAAVRLSYGVRNTGSSGFHYIWSAHPLIAAGESFSIRMPGPDLTFVTFPEDGQSYRWPLYGDLDLSREWPAHGQDLKIFVSDLAAGWCELIIAGRRFRFEFDVNQNPTVGFWFNNYGFRSGGDEPFRCIAVEPCTSPTDVLHALPPAAYPFIAPGAVVNWAFTLVIE